LALSVETIIRILREGLMLVLLLSAGPMLASMLVGLVVSIVQATTQIQEQTLSYVPKLAAVFVTIGLLGPWILAQAVKFTVTLFETIPNVR
jgi:flagellar biosynthetic protein FliQ